jgi:hypothetical protein
MSDDKLIESNARVGIHHKLVTNFLSLFYGYGVCYCIKDQDILRKSFLVKALNLKNDLRSIVNAI